LALCIALRKEYTFRRGLGPMFECVTELAMVTAKRLRGADVNNAARSPFEDDIELAEPHRPQWRGCVGLYL
jgi:hypothetical protein